MLLIEALEYLTDVFQFNLYAKCRSSLFHAFFSGPEVMTSQQEVTTFWGRLGSFGDKISLKKMGSSNAFPVPDGIGVFITCM